MNHPRENRQLVADAIAIWRAGVEAVRADQLVENAIRIENDELWIAEQVYDLRRLRRIIVVGAGKAGTGMARGLEHALGPQLLAQKAVAGWINVPDDCVQPLSQIHLHGARPAGLNEPTAAGGAIAGCGAACFVRSPVWSRERIASTGHSIKRAGACIDNVNRQRMQVRFC